MPEEPVTEGREQKKISRWDWILLPILGLVTIVVLLGSVELISRLIYPKTRSVGEDCMVVDTSSPTLGATPHSVCWEKIAEGKLVQYRFNSSGYRSDTDYGPKRPGTFRIVMLGSSYVAGARVSLEEAFATTLGPELSRRTGRKIEIINQGMAGVGGYSFVVALRMKEALALKPDMILRVLTPWDIQNQSYDPNVRTLPQPFRHPPLLEWTRQYLMNGRSTLVLRHLLYESQSQYVKSFLMGSDYIYHSGFLKADMDADWKKQLILFDSSDAAMEEQVKAAGVPLAATFIPLRAQAAMVSMGVWPPDSDPFNLDNKLGSIIKSHGGIYIDILPQFRNIPNPEQGYYPVEGHLNTQGHAMVMHLLADGLTSGAVPALSMSGPQLRTAREKGR